MENNENSKPDEVSNFLREEFKIRVETYKSYLNIALQANVFFYVTTGAVLAFYFSKNTRDSPFLDFILLLPILIGAVLGGIFIYAAKLQKEASIIIEKIRWESDKKGYSIAELPDINLLYLLLLIFGRIFVLVAISLIIVPYFVSAGSNYTLFTIIALVILVVGRFSMPITHSLDGMLRKTKKSNMSNFSAEERALKEARILRLPESQDLPKPKLERLILLKEKFRSLNGETVIKALINEHDETDIAFWDTSAILLLCCSQIFTAQLRMLQREHPKIVVWSGTEVEMESGLKHLKDDSILTDKLANKAREAWQKIYKSSLIVEPVKRVDQIADVLCKYYGLRMLDSFQLAAALVWCREKPRCRPFITANKKLAEVAEKEGFTKILLT